MIINDRNIKTWSLIGQRATFGLVALEVVKEREELLILTSDVSTSAGLDRFRKNHPNNFIDVGIAEQNLIGIAAGLASEKFKVITTTFSPFQTLRCCEQIKVNFDAAPEGEIVESQNEDTVNHSSIPSIKPKEGNKLVV